MSYNRIKGDWVMKINKRILRHFAPYVWWEKPEYLIESNPLRIIANAMRYANNEKEFVKLYKLDKDVLKKALEVAQAGWFDKKSWAYWHYILYGSDVKIPPLPQRKFKNEA